MSDNRSAADCIAEYKTSSGTKYCYHSKLGYIIIFFKSKDEFRNLVDENGELVLPLPFSAFKALFGQISTDPELPKKTKREREIRRIDDCDDEDDEDHNEVVEDHGAINLHTVSKSCLGGYKSALKNHYSSRHVSFTCPDLPKDETSLNVWCDEFIKSYGNLIADKKTRGVMPAKEGKSEISFSGYEKLNKAFIDFKPKPQSGLQWIAGILCFCCSTLQWNLVCRSEVLDYLHCSHMSW